MPTYEYRCKAGHNFDVVKRISELDRDERCDCGEGADRQVTLPAPVSVTAGDWNRVSYNPGLGQWTKSWKHGREVAKSKGLVEVGDTPMETVHKDAERTRADRYKARWDDDRVKQYD